LCNSCASLAGLILSFIACFILLVIAPLALCPGREPAVDQSAPAAAAAAHRVAAAAGCQ